MQYAFSCLPSTSARIESALSHTRLEKYVIAANGDKAYAIRLYIWNIQLCEALYLPLQMAEISVRNAIVKTLRRRFGEDWHNSAKFKNILPNRIKEELERTITKEATRRSAPPTTDQIIAKLTFGFWVNLLSRRYEKQLWATGVSFSFPNAGLGVTRETLHLKLEGMRTFRNKLMHHGAVFDKTPHKNYQDLLDIIGMVCPETAWLVQQTASVSQTINVRPQF